MKAREKLQYLARFRSIADVQWQLLTPDQRHSWIVPENAAEFSEMLPIGSKEARSGAPSREESIFVMYSVGVKTNRDEVAYDFDKKILGKRVRQFIEDYNAEVDRYRRSGGETGVDDFVRYDKIKWSRDLKQDLVRGNAAEFDQRKIRSCLYRPFCKYYLFFDRIINEEVYGFPRIFPVPDTEAENRIIILSDIGYRAPSLGVMMANCIADLHLCASSDSHQCFPFYVYDEDGSNRRENITDWA